MKEESKELTPVEWLADVFFSQNTILISQFKQAQEMDSNRMTEQQFIKKFKASGLELFETKKVHEAYEVLEKATEIIEQGIDSVDMTDLDFYQKHGYNVSEIVQRTRVVLESLSKRTQEEKY